ncbi:MAG: hypothetical protein ACKVIH_09560 [Burkholderiales bacterium]
MSSPTANDTHDHAEPDAPIDTIESLANVVPVVLPLVGGVLMFLLAFIAIYMA